jgi:hypothetical protein
VEASAPELAHCAQQLAGQNCVLSEALLSVITQALRSFWEATT